MAKIELLGGSFSRPCKAPSMHWFLLVFCLEWVHPAALREGAGGPEEGGLPGPSSLVTVSLLPFSL